MSDVPDDQVELIKARREIERLRTEVRKIRAVLERIWNVCHRPSKDHPKGSHAYTHFMADFDEIRALCKQFVDDAMTAPPSPMRKLYEKTMTNLVNLRAVAADVRYRMDALSADAIACAADEIERLRAENAKLRAECEEWRVLNRFRGNNKMKQWKTATIEECARVAETCHIAARQDHPRKIIVAAIRALNEKTK